MNSPKRGGSLFEGIEQGGIRRVKNVPRRMGDRFPVSGEISSWWRLRSAMKSTLRNYDDWQKAKAHFIK